MRTPGLNPRGQQVADNLRHLGSSIDFAHDVGGTAIVLADDGSIDQSLLMLTRARTVRRPARLRSSHAQKFTTLCATC